MNLFIRNIRKIKNLPLFRYNDFRANFIFVLFILFYFVLFEDLGTEMAKDKDEIGNFLSITNESNHEISIIDTGIFDEISCEKIISLSNFIVINKFISFIYSGRSPPPKLLSFCNVNFIIPLPNLDLII